MMGMVSLTTGKRVGIICTLVAGLIILGGLWLEHASSQYDSLNADLISAAKLGNSSDVRSLLRQGADPNTREPTSWRPGGVTGFSDATF